MVEQAVQEVAHEVRHTGGPGLTPRLLARIAELSGGHAVEVNVDLVVNNARVAALCAAAFAA